MNRLPNPFQQTPRNGKFISKSVREDGIIGVIIAAATVTIIEVTIAFIPAVTIVLVTAGTAEFIIAVIILPTTVFILAGIHALIIRFTLVHTIEVTAEAMLAAIAEVLDKATVAPQTEAPTSRIVRHA